MLLSPGQESATEVVVRPRSRAWSAQEFDVVVYGATPGGIGAAGGGSGAVGGGTTCRRTVRPPSSMCRPELAPQLERELAELRKEASALKKLLADYDRWEESFDEWRKKNPEQAGLLDDGLRQPHATGIADTNEPCLHT